MNTASRSTVPIFVALIVVGVGLLSQAPAVPQGATKLAGPPPPERAALPSLGDGRIAITSLPYTIDSCGSYLLTACLSGTAGSHGIEILSNGVTLDLGGFRISGVPGSLDGISAAPGLEGLVIRNGSVEAWGGNGIALSGAKGSQLAKLESSGNGGLGIIAGDSAVLNQCSARNNGAVGIQLGDGGLAESCVLDGNAGSGLQGAKSCVLRHCSSRSNGGAGIQLGTSSTVSGCLADGNQNDGFLLQTSTSLTGCSANNNVGNGFWVRAGGGTFANVVTDCTADHNGGNGIWGSGQFTHCASYFSGGIGIKIAIGSVVECTVVDSQGDGIEASNDTLVRDNQCWGNGMWGTDPGAGIHLIGIRCRVEGNNVSENRTGILVSAGASHNLLLRNSASGNTLDSYSILHPNNAVAPIIDVSATPGGFAADPSANLEF